MKKIISGIAALIMAVAVFTGGAVYAADNNHVTVYVNDIDLGHETNPVIINSRVMVPMRAIFEALGATVTWDQGTRTAIGVKDGVSVSLSIGSRTMYVGDKAVPLDSEPILKDDKTFMPLRAISEAYGYEVKWDNATKSAYIGSHARLDGLKNKVAAMTLDEKIYQMMIVTPESITGVEKAVSAGEITQNALAQYPVGGIIYFAQNIESADQVKQMIANTQSYSKTPLFIAVDEEGGTVARLGKAGIGFPEIPSMREIGDSGDAGRAAEIGSVLGENLKAYGFNVDFAPDADVAIISNSSVGSRSFGSDPNLVASMVRAEIEAMQGMGVSACAKHFPGLGSSAGDTHNGFVMTRRTLEQHQSCEFIPFAAAAECDADFTMVGHISVPEITGSNIPASMSSMMISMLRNDVGFSGVVTTDALNMGAIINIYTTSEACVSAVKAGADILLMPSDVAEAHYAVGVAASNGEISNERIDESVMRILNAKLSRGLISIE